MTGSALLNDPNANKGTAFSVAERRAYGLEGLLPPQVETIDRQLERALQHLDAEPNNLERYIYLTGLNDRNETLFYKVLMSDPARFVPIVYAPTLGEACRLFSHIYRRPRGMYITLDMKGRIAEVLRNWPHKDVRFICVTTGGRILSLGDIGVNGMGIPIGKLQLYTACGAVPPRVTMPIQLDIGTTNESLWIDPLYLGLRRSPPPPAELDAFVAEFIDAVQDVFPDCLIHFEDWKGTDALRTLARYKDRILCYNDDIQGTASVTLAGLMTALRTTGGRLRDQRVVFLGAGASAVGIADLLVRAMQDEGATLDEARAAMTMLDKDGPITPARNDLTVEQRPYARDAAPGDGLREVIERARPTVLVGVSTAGGTFTEEVVRLMGDLNERPIFFPLSIPHAECTADEAYRWTDGRALYAGGVQFPPVALGERLFYPGQANNFYIFPGLALASFGVKPTRVTDDVLIEAARALSDQIGPEGMAKGLLYPPQSDIMAIQITSACRLAAFMFDNGLAQVERPADIRAWIESLTYSPDYPAPQV
ncbi:NAD-dependent malic enzyme [Ameyamaea chiangmaiensis]|uniref:NAD-dependent malic enzyme n=1 Tax=Ameyamaea chiangmaiensis TaxID=442969 RepID=UPI003570A236